MKVREWLKGATWHGYKVVDILRTTRRDKAELLDAEVIGLCKTCKGERYVTGAEDFPGGDKGHDVTCSPCPDCADTPVWVIEPAAWEAFVCGVNDPRLSIATKADAQADYEKSARSKILPFGEWWAKQEKRAMPILQALLPSAWVATEVVTVDALGETHAAIGYLDRNVLLLSMRDGDAIAILATQAREGVGE